MTDYLVLSSARVTCDNCGALDATQHKAVQTLLDVTFAPIIAARTSGRFTSPTVVLSRGSMTAAAQEVAGTIENHIGSNIIFPQADPWNETDDGGHEGCVIIQKREQDGWPAKVPSVGYQGVVYDGTITICFKMTEVFVMP